MKREALCLLVSILFFWLVPADASGQVDRYWNNSAGGGFSFPFNWDTGVPFQYDHGHIDLPGQYTITITGDADVGTLSNGISAVVTINGGNKLTIHDELIPAWSILVTGRETEIDVLGETNFQGVSSLQVAENAIVRTGTTFVASVGTIGSINVRDNGLLNPQHLYLGTTDGTTVDGLAFVYLEPGGKINVGNTPDPVIEGFEVGSVGSTAEVIVLNGSVLSTIGDPNETVYSDVGSKADSEGCVVVDGSSASWLLNRLRVGNGIDRTGEVTVSGGARVSGDGTLTVGVTTGSTGEINVFGAGSSVEFPDGAATIGTNGFGQLSVSSGGAFESRSISSGSTGDSLISVNGNGSTVTSTTQTIIGSGSGSNALLDVKFGGTFQCLDGRLEAGFNTSSSGTINVNNGTLLIFQDEETNPSLIVGGSGTGQMTITHNGYAYSEREAMIGEFSGELFLEDSATLCVNDDFSAAKNTSSSSVVDLIDNSTIDVVGNMELAAITTSTAIVGLADSSSINIGGDFVAGEDGAVVATLSSQSSLVVGGAAGIGALSTLRISESEFDVSGPLTIDGEILMRDDANIVSSGDSMLTLAGAGKVVTENLAVSMFDCNIMNPDGVEIRTRNDCTTVFAGDYSGGSNFSGNGTVVFLGELRMEDTASTSIFDCSVELGSDSATFIQLGGAASFQFDRFEFHSNLNLDGNLSLELIDGFIPDAGDTFLIAEIDGNRTGTFDGMPEDALVDTIGGFEFRISYNQGDGNDIGLYVVATSSTVVPDSMTLLRGVLTSGTVTDLSTSDNQSVNVQRGSTDLQARTEFELTAFSNTATPQNLEVVLEGRVFARSQVVQSISMFDYSAGIWEEVDSRDASRIGDRTDIVTLSGDLSRFVNATTLEMKARIEYESVAQRQSFSSLTDAFEWRIDQ